MTRQKQLLKQWLDEKMENNVYWYCCESVFNMFDDIVCNMCNSDIDNIPRYRSSNFDACGVDYTAEKKYVKIEDEYFM
jgi:hypothetical protein